MHRSRALTPIALLALACREAEPSATGDRVELTTDVVAKVCRGTIEHIDAEIERIEAELALALTSERAEIHVVDIEHIGEFCDGPEVCIVQPPRRIYMTPAKYDQQIRYELVRDRISRTSAGATKPLLFEGLAGALARPSCEPSPIDWDAPSLTQVLEASSRTSLDNEGRYLGGELVRWLLDTRGPEQLFALMSDLNRYSSASEVRVAYLERFGSNIDADLFAHWRPDDALVDFGRAGCLGVEAAAGDAGSRVRLQADFDCDSPRVRNDFEDPSRVFVEWVIDVPEAWDGTWTLVDELPEGATLTIAECGCVGEPWSAFGASSNQDEPWNEAGGNWLNAGRHRLRVYSPIGTQLDIQLQARCDFAAQDCGVGQQCTHYGDCIEEADDPAQLGEPCEVPADYEAPRTCAAGLICVGPRGGQGQCMEPCAGDPDDWSCAGDLVCTGWVDAICTDACDPIAQGCESGQGCIPGWQNQDGCVPVGDAGLFEPCRMFDLDCGPGLICESEKTVPGCWDFVEGVGPIGCCSPICDATAPDPGCPSELPDCVLFDEGPFGRCGVADP